MTSLAAIEGIGDQKKLRAAGVGSAEALLERGASRRGRKELAEATRLGERQLLEWVNHADLFRVKGIGGGRANLLEAAGVDSVPELARRSPASLARRLAEVNERKRLVRQAPSPAQVEGWVAQAKRLGRVVKH